MEWTIWNILGFKNIDYMKFVKVGHKNLICWCNFASPFGYGFWMWSKNENKQWIEKLLEDLFHHENNFMRVALMMIYKS